MTHTLALVPSYETVVTEPPPSRRAAAPRPKATTTQYIVTCRQALLRKYGPRGFALLDGALTALAERTQRSQPTAARVIYADDAASLQPFGLWPATPGNAADFKRIIEALHTLSGTGTALPTVLLVGGDDIVPYFRWAHPGDGVILTDAPYAATGDAVFAPTRAVGRLPDALDDNPALLLQLLDAAAIAHERTSLTPTLGQRLRQALPSGAPAPKAAVAFGYAAHYWQEAAREVWRAIGNASGLRVSPPGGPADVRGQIGQASFLYFALGGSRHSPDWWGHHDTRFPSADHPYAIALRPEDLHSVGMAGATVFTTASFAGDVCARQPHESLAWQFLAQQASGVIASTTRAYGSLALPLAGADLLARYVIEALGAGERLGPALALAKARYAREMLATYGWLDMEDQQTLLGFSLLGDPALSPAPTPPVQPQSVPDLLPGLAIPGLRAQLRDVPQPLARVPLDVQRRAFDHATTHLPHMAEARVVAARPILDDAAHSDDGSFMDERWRAAHPGQLSADTRFTFRHTVNLSTDVRDARTAHITISPRGELLRMVVSR